MCVGERRNGKQGGRLRPSDILLKHMSLDIPKSYIYLCSMYLDYITNYSRAPCYLKQPFVMLMSSVDWGAIGMVVYAPQVWGLSGPSNGRL